MKMYLATPNAAVAVEVLSPMQLGMQRTVSVLLNGNLIYAQASRLYSAGALAKAAVANWIEQDIESLQSQIASKQKLLQNIPIVE